MSLRTMPDHSERSTGVPPQQFFSAYSTDAEQPPGWEIDRPQPAMLEVLRAGRITGRVLDSGCGTGALLVEMAHAGLDVVGIDLVPEAIQKATVRRDAAGFDYPLHVGSSLELTHHIEGTFDTVVDSGVWHVFTDADRAVCVQQLKNVIKPGGTFLMLVFHEDDPGTGHPRRIARHEIEDAFADGWNITSLDVSRFVTRSTPKGKKAWLAEIERL